MGYRKIAFTSLSWVGLFRTVLRLSAFIRTAILARILTPAEFGVFGIAAIVLGLLEMFTETGVNVVLIQEDKKQLKTFLNTAYMVSILRGIIILLIMLVLTPLISNFFQQPTLIPLIALMSLVPLLRGFINPAIVSFQKNLRFKQEFIFKSMILLADATVAITVAVLYQTATSLVFGLIAGVVVEIILSHLFIRPRPKFEFNRTLFFDVINRGKWITGAGIFSYLAFKTPDIVLGRLINTTSLGFYQMAYRFALIPFEEIVEVLNRVSFPLYTQVSGDVVRLRQMVVKNLAIYIVPAIILTLSLYSLTDYLVPTLLGQQWINIIPYMKSMSLGGFLLVLSGAVNPIYLAMKQQRYLTITTFTQMVIMLAFIIPGILIYGVFGAVLVYLASLVLTLPLRWYLAYKCVYS
jgi:O-antigen/teichoic acid export membrane protein